MKYWGVPAILLIAAGAWVWHKLKEFDDLIIGTEEEKQ